MSAMLSCLRVQQSKLKWITWSISALYLAEDEWNFPLSFLVVINELKNYNFLSAIIECPLKPSPDRYLQILCYLQCLLYGSRASSTSIVVIVVRPKPTFFSIAPSKHSSPAHWSAINHGFESLQLRFQLQGMPHASSLVSHFSSSWTAELLQPKTEPDSPTSLESLDDSEIQKSI